jgi:hypothetical protein
MIKIGLKKINEIKYQWIKLKKIIKKDKKKNN